jgi:hypothetical protein
VQALGVLRIEREFHVESNRERAIRMLSL